MENFEYVPARTVEEAVSLFSRENGAARILAGGTDLLVQLREGRRQASVVIDIKAIPEVNSITYDPRTGLRIGAAVPCLRVSEYLTSIGMYPALRSAVELIGGTQIQGRASLGGNLCNASPAADSIPALIIHHAVCNICGPDGYRQLPAAEFCTAPGKNALQQGEILVSIHVPPTPKGFGACYLRFTPRNEMDIAVAGAGASLVLDETRSTILAAAIALSAVAPVPLSVPAAVAALVGRRPTPEVLQGAARIARDAASPIDDLRGTAVQRKHLVGVLTGRALSAALSQALQGG